MDLKGRVGLVTGGATGIGRATVLALARARAAGVVINYRSARAEAEQSGLLTASDFVSGQTLVVDGGLSLR